MVGKVNVLGGEIYITHNDELIRIILGSCVSVILHDNQTGTSGINHFVSPLGNRDVPNPLRYGNLSIPELINRFSQSGSSLYNIEARVFGGSNRPDMNESLCVGLKNAQIAFQLLKERGITVIEQDTEGCKGRELLYHTGEDKLEWRYLNTCLMHCKTDTGCPNTSKNR
ncbi:chemotaxis protein CheD [Spirochaeta cellobiosiphila]|uniref:chemotaxis protein CheD n=1 Tax=Spirochaeta cellobiosiphila TaxID=504483 RepID=UPI00146E9FE3|nr:chemotaxis protein CheD [Spirochaeta cellobiosiphila]